MSINVRKTLITVCFLAAGSLFIYAAVKLLFKRPKMAASPEAWMARAEDPKTGKTLNFREFPTPEPWTKLCFFQGHSTDAEFTSVIAYPSDRKLSDKSKSTTHKDHLALAFVNDDSKKVVLIYDIPEKRLRFDSSLFQKCVPQSSSKLTRAQPGNENTGPLFK